MSNSQGGRNEEETGEVQKEKSSHFQQRHNLLGNFYFSIGLLGFGEKKSKRTCGVRVNKAVIFYL